MKWHFGKRWLIRKVLKNNSRNMKKQVWIDTDLSVGKKRSKREGLCDVDDGYAILQLMKSEQVNVNGISAVFGNTDIESSYSLCQYMSKEFAFYSIPVFQGAGKEINLNSVETNEAVEALADALRKERLIIMAIGPATNLGILLLKYPELNTQIEEVVLVAGRRTAHDFFAIGDKGVRAQDLNFDSCNHSFRVLFEMGINVTLCPFEISNKVWLTQSDMDYLAKGDKGCQWLAKHSIPWLKQWEAEGAKGFNPFDVLASHYIISSEDIDYEDLNARLEIHPDDTVSEKQKEVFKNYLLCDKGEGYPVRYCYGVKEGFHQKLMHSIF